jgi:hypothetical protein
MKTKKVNVLWLGLEERPHDIARRFDDLGAGDSIHFQPGPMRASSTSMEAMETYAVEKGIGLVVVDTLSKFWSLRDENDAADVDRALDSLLRFARKTNTAVLLLHHLRKNPADDGSDIRGSSAIFAAMDNAIALRRDEKSETRRTLTCLSRYNETPARLIFDMQADKLKVLKEEEAYVSKWSGLLSLLNETGQGVKTLAAKAELSESTARRLLREAAQRGEIIRDGSGRKGTPETFRTRTASDPAPSNEPLVAIATDVFGEVADEKEDDEDAEGPDEQPIAVKQPSEMEYAVEQAS